jgi:hypothetical protein
MLIELRPYGPLPAVARVHVEAEHLPYVRTHAQGTTLMRQCPWLEHDPCAHKWGLATLLQHFHPGRWHAQLELDTLDTRYAGSKEKESKEKGTKKSTEKSVTHTTLIIFWNKKHHSFFF